jgi:insulysin
MRVEISGYDDKLLTLLEAVFAKVSSFDEWADEQRFELLKEQIRREYKNFYMNQPYQHARYSQGQLLSLSKWDMAEYLDVIGDLTLADVKLHTTGLLSRMKLTMLVAGNLTEADARKAATVVETSLSPLSLSPSQIPRARAIKLDPGNRLFHFAGPNENEDNGATVVYYEVSHRNTRRSVSLDLLAQIANKPAFEILRTQQQLGYIVFTYKELHQGVAGLGFIVQRDRKSVV